MHTESRDLAGVGALIVAPRDRILTVREKYSSINTVKEIGMRTHPMESVEVWEISPYQTLGRVFREEIKLPQNHQIEKVGELCDVQITNGIWVRMFLYQADYEYPVSIGTAKDEVEDPDWTPIDEILTSEIGSRRFRPGVRETALSYLAYKLNKKTFTMFEFPKAEDEAAVLARLQANQNIVLSRPNFAPTKIFVSPYS